MATPDLDYTDPDALPRGSQVVTLAPGATPGTFAFTFRGTVGWAGPAEWPVAFVLGPDEQPLARVVVRDGAPFELVAELPPGRWQTMSLVADDATVRWWDALGPVLELSADGVLACGTNCFAPEHSRKLDLVAPEPMAEVSVARPELRWAPVAGAGVYFVRWFELGPPGRSVLRTVQDIRVDGTAWTFAEDVVPGRLYQWDVEACRDAHGPRHRPLARMNGYFRTPGASLAELDVPSTWLGVELVPPGTRVGRVVPGSPADGAGLRTGDVVLGYDDVRIEEFSDLIRAVGRTPAGSTVALRIRDADGRERVLRPTIAARPAPPAVDPIDALRP